MIKLVGTFSLVGFGYDLFNASLNLGFDWCLSEYQSIYDASYSVNDIYYIHWVTSKGWLSKNLKQKIEMRFSSATPRLRGGSGKKT